MREGASEGGASEGGASEGGGIDRDRERWRQGSAAECL